MFRMRGLIFIIGGQRVLIEIAANSRWCIDCTAGITATVALYLYLADEFLEVLIDIIGSAIAE